MNDKINQIISLAKKNESATFSSGDQICTLMSASLAGIDTVIEPEKKSFWYVQDELSFKLLAELESLEAFQTWAIANKLMIDSVQK